MRIKFYIIYIILNIILYNHFNSYFNFWFNLKIIIKIHFHYLHSMYFIDITQFLNFIFFCQIFTILRHLLVLVHFQMKLLLLRIIILFKKFIQTEYFHLP